MSKNVDVQIKDTFEIGSNASRSIHLQIDRVISSLDETGEKKKTDVENAQAAFAERGEKLTAHDKGQNTGIHSFGTLHKFQGNCYRFGDFCRKEFKCFSLEKITPQAVTGFFNRLSDLGYSHNTVNGYISAVEKLGSRVEVGEQWHNAIKEFKASDAYKNLEHKDTSSRAYGDNAQKIIDAISNEKAQVAAIIAKETGLRRGEVCHFTLKGSEIVSKGKNGMELHKSISDELKARIAPLTDENGRFNLSPHTLSHAWERAARSVGVSSNGIHGLRHDKAQADVRDGLAEGKTVSQSMKGASEDLSHHRESITYTYLR